jgi:hypothetical protein
VGLALPDLVDPDPQPAYDPVVPLFPITVATLLKGLTIPAGDSGQFELRGIHGILHVEDGRPTTAERGRTGLQTLPFAQ